MLGTVNAAGRKGLIYHTRVGITDRTMRLEINEEYQEFGIEIFVFQNE